MRKVKRPDNNSVEIDDRGEDRLKYFASSRTIYSDPEQGLNNK